MSPLESKITDSPEKLLYEQAEAAVKKFLSRDDWLNQAGVLKEEEVEVEGFGLLLISEVTGDVRAEILGDQSVGLLADQRKIDAKVYQRKLILAGVIDPTSPKGDRKPLFRMGDMDRVMKIGGGKIADVVDAIERLSSLGQYAGVAEGNSVGTQNGASTS